MAGYRRRVLPAAAPLAMFLLVGGTTGACSDPWPETRPADFAVRHDFDAGMLPRYWRLEVKGTEGRYEARQGRDRTSFTFTIGAAEADALYSAFRKNRFDRIEEESRGRVHDRGGTSIAVTFGRTHMRKSNAGESFIAKSSYGAWRAVSAALDRLRANVLADRAKRNP